MRIIGAIGLAMVLAAASAPALAIEIDLDNLPPWPKRHIGQNDMPSRFDKAPVEALLAAKDAGVSEAGSVYWRRLWANDPAMLAWARAGAAQNNPHAMVILAQMVAKTDQAESLRLYRAAADLGDTSAMNALADAYVGGRGVDKNVPEALRLWTQAAEKGDGSAIVNLMNIYRAGVVVPRDPEAVAKWEAVAREKSVQVISTNPPPSFWRDPPRVDQEPLLRAAQAGDTDAMVKLAASYERDYPSPGQAFFWYKAAAEKGDARGMFGVGQAYRNGAGVRQDEAAGVEWLLKAAKAGNITAMYNLERIYSRGEGVKADPEQAKYWRYQAFFTPDERD